MLADKAHFLLRTHWTSTQELADYLQFLLADETETAVSLADKIMRLGRTKWTDPNALAQELAVIFRGERGPSTTTETITETITVPAETVTVEVPGACPTFPTTNNEVFYFPSVPPISALDVASLTYASFLINGATEKAAFSFIVPKTGTLKKVGWRTNTVTTGADVTVSIQGRSGDAPDGTALASAIVTVANGDDNAWFLTTLDSPLAVTRGQERFLVIANSGAGDMTIAALTDWQLYFPYGTLFGGASWSSASPTSSNAPVLALEYSDGTYPLVMGCYPYKTINNEAFANVGAVGLVQEWIETGVKLTLPYQCFSDAFWVTADVDSNAEVRLYDSGSTLMASYNITFRSQALTGTFVKPWSSTQTLEKDRTYRLVVRHNRIGGSPVTDIGVFTVDKAAVLDALEWGSRVVYTTRSSSGQVWSEVSTKRCVMGLVLQPAPTG